MKYTRLVIPLFTLGLSLFPSQSSGFGCPSSVVAMRKLPLDKFLGTWYEYKYNNRVYDTPGRCTTMQFTRNKVSMDVIDITITDRVRYNEVVNYGKLKLKTPDDDSGFFKVSYYFTKRTKFRRKKKTEVAIGEFKVLGTDGDCWAVVYSCEEALYFKDQQTQVLVKDKDFKCVTKEKLGQIAEVLSSEVGLTLTSMKTNDQLGCNPVDQLE